VAKVLRDELALRGIRSLTAKESEAIAARIFERITELELELAARISTSPRAATTDQRDEPRVCPFTDPLRARLDNVRSVLRGLEAARAMLVGGMSLAALIEAMFSAPVGRRDAVHNVTSLFRRKFSASATPRTPTVGLQKRFPSSGRSRTTTRSNTNRQAAASRAARICQPILWDSTSGKERCVARCSFTGETS
jgi:hypothetical protein